MQLLPNDQYVRCSWYLPVCVLMHNQRTHISHAAWTTDYIRIDWLKYYLQHSFVQWNLTLWLERFSIVSNRMNVWNAIRICLHAPACRTHDTILRIRINEDKKVHKSKMLINRKRCNSMLSSQKVNWNICSLITTAKKEDREEKTQRLSRKSNNIVFVQLMWLVFRRKPKQWNA